MKVTKLLKLFFANEEVSSIFEIDYRRLKNEGKEAIIFDLDNTLCQYKGNLLDKEVINLFAQLRQMGFSVGILTNNQQAAKRKTLQKLDVPVVFGASKPRRRGYRKILTLLNEEPINAVMVGDQMLTDVLGANRLSIHTILVKPLHPQKEYFATRINRLGERFLIRVKKIYQYLREAQQDNLNRD